MSKNYNKYYNGNYNNDIVDSEETTNVVTPEDVIEDTTVVDPEPEVVEEPTTPKVFYRINNCKKLNVRTEPNKDADVVCVIDSTNSFEIEELESNPEWVKVISDKGTEGFSGYCMKQYVSIK